MRNKKAYILIILLLFLGIMSTWTEEIESSNISDLINYINTAIRIKTVQRGNFQGILKEVSDDHVEIISRDGQILFIDLSSIESYTVFISDLEKNIFFQDSASNRLIVMPTGFAMEPGEFHVANQELGIMTMSYGLNEHVSLWTGVSIPGIMVNARYTATLSPSFALSFGSYGSYFWIEDFTDSLVLPYCLASWGEPNNNITLGAGPAFVYGSQENQSWDFPGVIGVMGAKKVLTSSTSIIFENWIIWGKRRDFASMLPIPWSIEDPPKDYYEEKWSGIPLLLTPALCFRIAGPRLSWDIGIVIPLLIKDEEEIEIDPETGDEGTHYWQNIDLRLEGIADGIIIPIPVLSVTYRID